MSENKQYYWKKYKEVVEGDSKEYYWKKYLERMALEGNWKEKQRIIDEYRRVRDRNDKIICSVIGGLTLISIVTYFLL